MNIFYLDTDPQRAARYHANVHVPKMIVEAAQILSKVHWEVGYDGPDHVDHGTGPYKSCRNVGRTLGPKCWAAESLANYRWAIRLGFALCDEFKRRFSGREHRTKPVLEWLQDHEPDIPDVGPTTPRLAFDPAYCGNSDDSDPVGSYRTYYRDWKRKMKKWSAGETPRWFKEVQQ